MDRFYILKTWFKKRRFSHASLCRLGGVRQTVRCVDTVVPSPPPPPLRSDAAAAFLHRSAAAAGRWKISGGGGTAVEKRLCETPFVLSLFSLDYACPEPVLANESFVDFHMQEDNG